MEHKQRMVRINLNVAEGLLKIIDKAAQEDFTTRSEIIRAGVLWYLRPQGRDPSHADSNQVLKTLQHRKIRAATRAMLRDA